MSGGMIFMDSLPIEPMPSALPDAPEVDPGVRKRFSGLLANTGRWNFDHGKVRGVNSFIRGVAGFVQPPAAKAPRECAAPAPAGTSTPPQRPPTLSTRPPGRAAVPPRRRIAQSLPPHRAVPDLTDICAPVLLGRALRDRSLLAVDRHVAVFTDRDDVARFEVTETFAVQLQCDRVALILRFELDVQIIAQGYFCPAR